MDHQPSPLSTFGLTAFWLCSKLIRRKIFFVGVGIIHLFSLEAQGVSLAVSTQSKIAPTSEQVPAIHVQY